jgi:hypothetical protein
MSVAIHSVPTSVSSLTATLLSPNDLICLAIDLAHQTGVEMATDVLGIAMTKKTDMLETPDVTGRGQENEMPRTKAREQNDKPTLKMMPEMAKKREENAAVRDREV